MKDRHLRLPVLAAALVLAGCADLTYDATPPVVHIVYPVSWSVVAWDTVDIRADVYDNLRIADVAFFADGESIALLNAEPFRVRWYPDTTGNHTVYCHARDAAGNETHTDPVIVTVMLSGEAPDQTAPYVALVRPAAWSVVGDFVRIEAIAWDDRVVSRVTFYLDGDSLAVAGAAPWQHLWDSRTVGNGYHTIYATAVDGSGNRAYSGVITVDVLNAP